MFLYRVFVFMVILFIVLSSTGFTGVSSGGFVRSVVVYAPAVARGGGGAFIQVNLSIVYPGSGRLFFSAKPLVELDTQATARIASYVAASIAGVDYYSYDYYVVMTSNSLVVGGPSAGALITVGFLSLFLNKTLNKNIAITGMINPDGSIGPVGGLLDKLDAVASSGYKVFLIPLGQRIVYVEERIVKQYPWGIYETVRYKKVDMVEKGLEKGVVVLEVANIFDAMKYFLNMTINPGSIEYNVSSSIEEIVKNNVLSNLEKVRELYIENTETYKTLDLYTQIQLSQYYQVIKTYNTTIESMLKKNMIYALNDYIYDALEKNLETNMILRYINHNINIDTVLDKINNTIENIYPRLNRTLRNNCNEFIVEAYKQYYQAISNYMEILEKKQNINPLELYSRLAETYVDLIRVNQYLEIGDIVEKHIKYLSDKIFTLYSLAETTLSYAYSLARDIGGSNNYLSEASNVFQKAVESYRGNNTYATIGLLIETIVLTDLGIEKLFINNKTVLENISNYLELKARYYIGLHGNNMYSKYMYLVGKQYLETDNPYKANYFFIKLILYKTIEEERGNIEEHLISIHPVIPHNKNYYSPNNRDREAYNPIIYYLLGLGSGILVSLLIVMAIYNRRNKGVSIL